MYNLADFIAFHGSIESLDGSKGVLLWSEKSGYFFQKWGYVQLTANIKIIAKEK